MFYKDIIIENQKYHTLWPQYAFHMAGLENALNILKESYIFSRNKAVEYKMMKSDNASSDVLKHTDKQVKDYARFYFRPKNPTYYHMEGYHQKEFRYNNDSVNLTIPILFMFDLETLLENPRTVFNATNASGKDNFHSLQGERAFRSLAFDKIYSIYTPDKDEILKYRNAEILYPSIYPLDLSLKKIVCRNKSEETTLRTELRKYDAPAYDKWKSYISNDESLYPHRHFLFDKTGLRIVYNEQSRAKNEEDVLQLEFVIVGHEKYYEYIKRRIAKEGTSLTDYPPLKVIFAIQYDGSPCHHEVEHSICLTKEDIIKETLSIPNDAKKLKLQVFFDEKKDSNLAFSGVMPLTEQLKRCELVLNARETIRPFPKKPDDEKKPETSDELPF